MIDQKVGFEKYIQMATNALKGRDYAEAEKRIKQAMLIQPHSAKVHNLYGILEECLKDCSLANKHYRAALALEPTYKPSIRNLERITTFYAYNSRHKFDFGDKPEEEEHEPLYQIVYDNHNVGHLCK
jgi:lipoprotein NlpI